MQFQPNFSQPPTHKYDSIHFVQEFYRFPQPIYHQPMPLPDNQSLKGDRTDFTNSQLKSDLKLIFQIAAKSRLKVTQDYKQEDKQIFYCRDMGKQCFKFEVIIKPEEKVCILNDDIRKMKHLHKCEENYESSEVIKIYNLMMLKRGIIEQYVLDNDLLDKSPEHILTKISSDVSMTEGYKKAPSQYFYAKNIEDMKDRRKLKKRFDNIINITIKKKWESLYENPQNQSLNKVGDKIREWKNKKQSNISKQNINKEAESEKQNQNRNQKPTKMKLDRSQKLVKPIPSNSIKKKLRSSIQNKVQSSSGSHSQSSFQQEQSLPTKRIRLNQNQQKVIFQKPSQRKIKFDLPPQDQIYEEQDNDHFSNSSFDIEGAMNEIQNNSCWLISNPSIAQAIDMGEKMRMDDLFASLRNSLLRSVERKSLRDIEPNITQFFRSKQSI